MLGRVIPFLWFSSGGAIRFHGDIQHSQTIYDLDSEFSMEMLSWKVVRSYSMAIEWKPAR